MFRFFRIRKDVEFIIHIGPHRTGSRFIQKTLQRNSRLYENKATNLSWRDKRIAPVRNLMLDAQTRSLATANAGAIQTAMTSLANGVSPGRYVLSCEDFLGSLPMRWRIKGLYPYVEITLRALVQGLLAGGAKVTVCFYQREYRDWLQSVYYRRHDDAPEVKATHEDLVEQFELPPDWSDFHARLRKATKGASLRILSFEDDRDKEFFGASLFREIGMSESELIRLNVSADQNASKTRPRG